MDAAVATLNRLVAIPDGQNGSPFVHVTQ